MARKMKNIAYIREVLRKMGKKIQDATFLYTFLRRFVDYVTRHSYRKFQIEGVDRIPENGCTVWAENHTNALMDPLVILRTNTSPKVFVARADIFKSGKLVVKLLTFLKILPIYRIRDGFDAVKHNDEIIAKCVDVLSDGVPLSIFPEATHRAKHSLLKLSKGVFHIAYAVNDKVAGEKPVYIQPIGIDYSDYFRYRPTVLVRFGEPINITEFLRENAGVPQPQQMLRLKEILAERMASLITFVPDDDDYDAIWEYAKLKADNPQYFAEALTECEREAGRQLKGLERNQAVNRHAVAEALKLRDENPEKAAELFQKIDRRRVWRIQNGVSVHSIARDEKWPKALMNLLLVLLGLPYYLFCVIVCLIVWLPSLLILRKVDDDAFYNSVRTGARLALSWIYVVGFAIAFFSLLPLIPAIICTLLLLPAYDYFTDYREFVRLKLSDIRWLFKKRSAPQV